MRRCNYTNHEPMHEIVSLKLESSRNVTSNWYQIPLNCIKTRKSKSTEQYDSASFSFASAAHETQWSNYLTRQAETRRSNLTPQRAKNTGTEVAFDIEQVGFTFPLFSSRDQQAAVDSLLRMELILPNISLLLNTPRKKTRSQEVGLNR